MNDKGVCRIAPATLGLLIIALGHNINVDKIYAPFGVDYFSPEIMVV